MKLEELTEDQKIYWMKMVDESVMQSTMDPELREGFAYLDELAYKKKISFYDVVLEIYEKSEMEFRINEWKKEKRFYVMGFNH